MFQVIGVVWYNGNISKSTHYIVIHIYLNAVSVSQFVN